MFLMLAGLAMTERILVPKMRFDLALSRSGQFGHGLHHLDAFFLVLEALVHLQERNDAFYAPEVIGGRLFFDLPLHGVFEQDGPNNPLAGEAGAGDDARAHLVHEIKHLIVVGPGVVLDSVQGQRVRGAAAALIQRRDESGMGLHFLQLLFVQDASCHDASFNFRYRRIRLLVELSWARVGSSRLFSAGSRSRTASAKSVLSTLDTKRNLMSRWL